MRSNRTSAKLRSILVDFPIGLMADIVVVGQIGNDHALHLQRIDGALALVGDLPVARTQHGRGTGAIPIAIESREQGIDVGRAEDQVSTGGVQLVKRRQDSWGFVRIVDTYADQVE